MIESFLLPLAVLFILYLCLRAILLVIHHWISNRTIREAINKQPEAVGPLIDKLGTRPTGWSPKVVGWTIVAGASSCHSSACWNGRPVLTRSCCWHWRRLQSG